MGPADTDALVYPDPWGDVWRYDGQAWTRLRGRGEIMETVWIARYRLDGAHGIDELEVSLRSAGGVEGMGMWSPLVSVKGVDGTEWEGVAVLAKKAEIQKRCKVWVKLTEGYAVVIMCGQERCSNVRELPAAPEVGQICPECGSVWVERRWV